MEDDNPFGFSDDLVDSSPVKIKRETKNEGPSIEEWICRQSRMFVANWIKQKNQEKIQKYLSYDWNNTSKRVVQHLKKIVHEEKRNDNPLVQICVHGDPSGGDLLRVLLRFADTLSMNDFQGQKPLISTAATYKSISVEQLEMLLTHPNAIDPFTPTEPGNGFQCHPRETPIELTIRYNRLDYFKAMLQHSKSPQMDRVLKLACRHNVKILQYLVEEKGMSVNDMVCGKVPLQHALYLGNQKKPCVDYLLSRGADVNGKDKHGNPVILYAALNGYSDIDKLINADLDIRAKARKMKYYGDVLADGKTVFDMVATHPPNILKRLLEFKAKVTPDSEFDKQVIADILSAQSYTAIAIMWPFVDKRDIIGALLTEQVCKFKEVEETLTPIERLFKVFIDVQRRIADKDDPWSCYRLESIIRAIWRHLIINLSVDEVRTLLNSPTKSGERLSHMVASCDLLPEDYRLSSQLWKNKIERSLGALSTLPQEILMLIFGYLSFDEACQSASVSTSWFKEITAKALWQGHSKAVPNSSNPFRSIQRLRVDNRIRSRPRFHQVVRLDDGEGLLVLENGFLTGLKLNGEPIISTWPQFCGSVYRCIARCRSLSRDSIEAGVKQIEDMLNSGRIEYDSVVDTLMPFMKCLLPGFYDIQVQHQGDYKLFEYSSDNDFSNLETEFPFYPLVYFTQPSDLLDEKRVEYYMEKIQNGCRPAALAIHSGVELFLIDGHHKITAYKKLDLLQEMVVVSIGLHEVEFDSMVSEQEEMKYIRHSKLLMNRYEQSKKSMRINDD